MNESQKGTTLTAEEREELERLDKAATPGPWQLANNDRGLIVMSKENQSLTVAMRNALPALLAAARRVEMLELAICVARKNESDAHHKRGEAVQQLTAANARADALTEALTATLSPLINSSDVLDVMDSDDAGHLAKSIGQCPEARAILRRWRDECREAHAKALAALAAAKVPR